MVVVQWSHHWQLKSEGCDFIVLICQFPLLHLIPLQELLTCNVSRQMLHDLNTGNHVQMTRGTVVRHNYFLWSTKPYYSRCNFMHNLVRTWPKFSLLVHLWWNCQSNAGAIANSNAYFGRGNGPYHLDHVYCSGTESSLFSCNRGYSIGVHNCRPGKEAGVKCASKCAVPLCTESTLHGVSTWQT